MSLLLSVPLSAAPPYVVTFVIDMREEIAAKRFDPAKDSVGVRGGTDPLSWEETQAAGDQDGDGRYEVTVSFPERPFGGQPVNYKFKVESSKDPTAGWEEGKNRRLALEAAPQTVSRRYNEPPPPIQPVLTGTLRRERRIVEPHGACYRRVMRPIEARYEDGLLKPEEPLALKPGERVALIVIRHPDPKRWDLKRLAGGAEEDLALAEQGLAEWADTLDAEDRG